ncbi:mitochondrial ribosome-associated GTPase 2 [Ischnura elegans]|uniref:mitochondrial ribosome-associated GTPase 2 n=1 Tax=Ischnura elegans TaxID=197161 RepID=UPI001ED87E6D|nr:mitochondrial ribosome-associated GTPase 2 [Ischnura elegans]
MKRCTLLIIRRASDAIYSSSFVTSANSASNVYALRCTKPKSLRKTVKQFVDSKRVRAIGGKGGDGAISFMRLWANDHAGPDGGDGGNGGHVIFLASSSVNDLSKVPSVITGKDGERGNPKNRYGSNADHTIVEVPIGTVVKRLDPEDTKKSPTTDPLWFMKGKVVGDLAAEGTIYIGARGGAGGHGNAFFATDTLQSPQVAEFGAEGEDGTFILELKSMSQFGLIGYPNAGKSTFLSAVTRAKAKIAPYPFTTLKPQLGMVRYSDHEQLSVADLPGLLPGAHKNRGLGLSFLRHAERCIALLLIVDASFKCPWEQCEELLSELGHFDPNLPSRALLVLANKMDLPDAKENLENAMKHMKLPVIPMSAKMGDNLSTVLSEIRRIYDESMADSDTQDGDDES